jgi:hypothetical protein
MEPKHALVSIQPLAPDGSSFYYYAGGERVKLIPSLAWVSIQFARDAKVEQATALKDYSQFVGPLDQARQMPEPRLVLLPLVGEQTVQTLAQGINSMRARPGEFTQVNPVFQMDPVLLVITDRFIASFTLGQSREAINDINSKNHVEVMDPIPGQENTFLLRVLPEAGMDVLAMANYYQENGLATDAAPDFLRLRRP